MFKEITLFCSLCLSALSLITYASDKPFANTEWISYPLTDGTGAGVYHFRKSFKLEAVPDRFIIHVSADNRYRLYVNGIEVSHGPARGDVDYWQYETLDVAGWLQDGNNVIAAVVWNTAELSPWAQLSVRTGFILSAYADGELHLKSDETWKAYKNEAITFFKDAQVSKFPHGVGPGESIKGEYYPWGWETLGFDDSKWINAEKLNSGLIETPWRLIERYTPMMESKLQSFAEVRRVQGAKLNVQDIEDLKNLSIPTNSSVEIILDQGHLTNAYPILSISGGAGAEIRLTYNEAMFNDAMRKEHRDKVEGMQLHGLYDLIYPEGEADRSYKSLWYRTFRYAEIRIQTQDEPLVINNFASEFTAYPFPETIAFKSSDEQVNEIAEVAWRTARLCAHETYMDCPYYEQLNYVGDTRIQALISLSLTGDDRLMRQAIDHFGQSRKAHALTRRSYPSTNGLYIPPYSLIWISMIYDHWMWVGDSKYISQFNEPIQEIIDWFMPYLEEGLLTNLPDDSWDKSKNWLFDYWNFEDGSAWPQGVPPGIYEGKTSSIINLRYAYTLQHAALLMQALGEGALASEYQQRADLIRQRVKSTFWDENKGMISDTDEMKHYSQHANILGILTGLFEGKEAQNVFLSIFKNEDIAQCSLYYRFYLHEAMREANLGDILLDGMDEWRQFIELGFTTFPEHPHINTRSDCHAWSSSPLYAFQTIIAGMRPDSPGFNSLVVEPNVGALSRLSTRMPTPHGVIDFEYQMTGDGRKVFEISLPENLEGSFGGTGDKIQLEPGLNKIFVGD